MCYNNFMANENALKKLQQLDPEMASRINSKTTREELISLLTELSSQEKRKNEPVVAVSAQVPVSLNKRLNDAVEEIKKHQKFAKRDAIIEALEKWLEEKNF